MGFDSSQPNQAERSPPSGPSGIGAAISPSESQDESGDESGVEMLPDKNNESGE